MPAVLVHGVPDTAARWGPLRAERIAARLDASLTVDDGCGTGGMGNAHPEVAAAFTELWR